MAKAKIKRIFITGAPGSMWSSADRMIRAGFGSAVDNSDITPSRTWQGHLGAYWNPGNEPGYDWILNFDKYTREEIEIKLDSAYLNEVPDNKEYIIRMHKGHYWSYYFDHLTKLFPECDIITTRQEPHKAWLWWQMCDGHDHVHDTYNFYNRDYEAVWQEVNVQTSKIDQWISENGLKMQHLNLDFFREHYGEPSNLLKRMWDESVRHPDGLNSYSGQSTFGRNLGNTSLVTIRHGTPRIF
jgi:hypothetical protein